jgi:GxxExxY protein
VPRNALLFEKETYRIIGAAMEVHRIMGHGVLEAVYPECLAIELRSRGIPTTEHPPLSLQFKEHVLRKTYVPDFLCFDEIVVEIKAMSQCGPNEQAQLLNALRAASKPVGLLINFGGQSLQCERMANTRPRSANHVESA